MVSRTYSKKAWPHVTRGPQPEKVPTRHWELELIDAEEVAALSMQPRKDEPAEEFEKRKAALLKSIKCRRKKINRKMELKYELNTFE